jgi:hypothetical protein
MFAAIILVFVAENGNSAATTGKKNGTYCQRFFSLAAEGNSST